MTPTSGRVRPSSTSSTLISFNQMTDYEWLERDEIHLRELEVARPEMVQMEKTMHWWPNCTADRWGKSNKVCNAHNKMDAFVKKATKHEREKQELLNKIKMLKQKIYELDEQLRLSKENVDMSVPRLKQIT